MLPSFKDECIKQLIPRIKPAERSYFVHNENNIRLCHYINGKPEYIVIVFDEVDKLVKAATLLVECGIIDYYEKKEVNQQLVNVELYQYHYHLHIMPDGRKMNCIVSEVVEWNSLRLTKSEVQLFAAHFEFERCAAGLPAKHEARIIPLYSHTNSKKTA